MQTETQWLFKTEPSTYSFQNLCNDKKTNWNGVRNFQARNFLAKAAKGDRVLIYHSGDERAVVGIARVLKEAFPDPDPKKPGDWVQLEIEVVKPLRKPVPLATLKAQAKLKGLLLIKQSRLSCMPLTQNEFDLIVKLGS